MISFSSIIFLIAGFSLIYFFQTRRKQLSFIKRDDFPEFDDEEFQNFIILVKTAYERTLYMGVLFIPLALSPILSGYLSGIWSGNSDRTGEIFFMILIFFLFISNVIPRNKIMKILKEKGLSMDEIKKRGLYI